VEYTPVAIEITLNGEERTVADGISVAALVDELGLRPERVAVERNAALVRRTEHAATRLEAGDQVEIVTLVGGG
jgi:thiamine biosynthesis protein ThiS